MMNATLRNVIISIVAIVWAINFTAPIFVKDYTPAPELNVAFMAIIGALTQIKTKDDSIAPAPKAADTSDSSQAKGG